MSQAPPDRVTELIAAQREYYDLRAPDYADIHKPSDRSRRGIMTTAEVRAAVEPMRIEGDVLELACGSGVFTKELAARARSLTAVDGSPNMLEINRRAVRDERVDYVCADIFGWDPPRTFDFVFFGFWLSHVPPTHFDTFWETVRAALRPDGRCGFVDEDERAADNEAARSAGDVPTATRTLSDGRAFDIVKLFWSASDLQGELERRGWQATVRPVGAGFLVGHVTPTS